MGNISFYDSLCCVLVLRGLLCLFVYVDWGVVSVDVLVQFCIKNIFGMVLL